MKRHQWLLVIALAVASVTTTNVSIFADDPPDADPKTITMRDRTMDVWPFDDLRARGFEIADVPREDNAFWTYLDAVNGYKSVPQDIREAFDYAVGIAWPAGHDAELKKFILDKENQKALAIAREAARQETFQLYYFGDPSGSIISVLLPSLRDYRELGKLLVVDGRRLEHEGAYDLAMRDYASVLRMGHHTASGITLIENLVGVSLWALGDQAVQQLVLRRDLSTEQLEEILDTLNELEPLRPRTLTGVRNERVFGTTLIDELTASPLHFIRNVNALGSGGGGTVNLLSQQTGWHALEARVGKVLLPDQTIKRHMTTYYDELIDRSALPAYEARWDEYDEEAAVAAIPQWNVFARMLLPSLSRANIIGERCRMQSMITRLSVALRIHTKENDNEAPVRLTDLLDRVPAEDLIDPFTGREFIYDHRGPAWRVYSVGEDFIDDGGEQGEKPFKPDYVVRFPPPETEPFVAQEDEQDDSM